jgi:hypothetical protein
MEYKYKIMLRRHGLKQIRVPVRAKRAGSDRRSQARELLRKWLTKERSAESVNGSIAETFGWP